MGTGAVILVDIADGDRILPKIHSENAHVNASVVMGASSLMTGNQY